MAMLKIFLSLFVVFSLIFVSSCSSANDDETTVSKETIPAAQLIAQADELYKQREDLAKLRDAIALLRRARNADSQNYEAAWKLSRFNYYLGVNATDEKEIEKAFKNGIDAGKTAINLQKDKPDGYFWTAANLGGRAQQSPITYGLTSIGEIKENLNKVLEIQPNYQNGSAYDALSQIEMEAPGGNAEKALEYAQKGLGADGKDNAYIHLRLAQAYLKLDRKAEAKKEIDTILKMKPLPDYLPEYNDAKEEAEKLLKTRF